MVFGWQFLKAVAGRINRIGNILRKKTQAPALMNVHGGLPNCFQSNENTIR